MDISGYEGLYKIYKDGRIWSHRRQMFLKPIINIWGYAEVALSFNSRQKRVRIHRLVAGTFLKSVSGKSQINHRDGNKLNNHVYNLEWCDQIENIAHAVDNGLVQDFKNRKRTSLFRIRRIRERFLGGETVPQIAKVYCLSARTVRNIVYGRGYKNIYPELVSRWERRRPDHGTHSRYCKGCRCDSCRLAHAIYNRKRP